MSGFSKWGRDPFSVLYRSRKLGGKGGTGGGFIAS